MTKQLPVELRKRGVDGGEERRNISGVALLGRRLWEVTGGAWAPEGKTMIQGSTKEAV